MRIPLLLALAGVLALAAPAALAQTPTVLFDFEGAGGDTQGWQPDVAPDPDLGENARSLVRTLDTKPVGGGNQIDAFEGTWMLEAVANRPILAANFRGMKYEWATPQDWTMTPILKLAASMYANGPNSERHQFRIRVVAGTDTTEMIYEGLKSEGADDGTSNNSFVNDWEVLTFDLSEFDGLDRITAIEAAGRHADTDATGGTPVVATEDADGTITPIEGQNWGGNVQLDLVTVEARPVAVEGQPGLRSLSAAYPNPSAAAATLDLAVETSQRVTATVVDVLGRSVQTAFEGLASPSAAVPVRVDASRLAPGTYVVVVRGETFVQSRRLSVAR
ncbi:T9SS type A sorting domain-containing protein [Rubrivirga sp.]|uniref:T9SS type A sorting domain-containing protein n=1 Tax=Rubrivirga sp. TaxID=1885344 RepID=UPI003B524825